VQPFRLSLASLLMWFIKRAVNPEFPGREGYPLILIRWVVIHHEFTFSFYVMIYTEYLTWS
jgi:hypothetical protein